MSNTGAKLGFNPAKSQVVEATTAAEWGGCVYIVPHADGNLTYTMVNQPNALTLPVAAGASYYGQFTGVTVANAVKITVFTIA